ncbi:serine/threonine-protein kinase STY13-like isoform X2 [Silene latifolia]|uniref:serine/threonine-protein kinase STY13-like isoform X2 n=1 Tax=Silene latifolia TaxID=37657 RepID=UPI003D77535E
MSGEYNKRGNKRGVDPNPNSVSRKGSITGESLSSPLSLPLPQQLFIDETLLVDPKLLFIGSKIGEGAHGKVYEGRYHDRIVAIKVLNRGSTSDERAVLEDRFIREVNMMSRVKHENLVKFIGACKDPLMVIVAELLPGLSLRKYLNSLRPKQLELDVALRYALDIAKAMACLHANGIIHRDLKPDNLLLTVDHKSVKLADFGLAREETLTEMMTAETGTYRWMAPELYSTVTLRQGEKKHYNNKQDRPIIPDDVPPDLVFIIQSCWVEDPNLRPSFSQIIRMLNVFLYTLAPPPPPPVPPQKPTSDDNQTGSPSNNAIIEFSVRARGKFSFIRQLFTATKRTKNLQ